MFVKPLNGLRVLYPASKRVLPEGGAEVSESSYWLRRAAHGDVEVVEQAEPEPKAKSKAATPPDDAKAKE